LVTKKLKGEFIGSKPPYGYQKSPENKNRLCPDINSAAVVALIYKFFLDGKNITEICKSLTKEKILTPKAMKTGETDFQWNKSTIRRILSNPTYAGHLTQNKSQKISYKINKKNRLPRENWITVYNTHEPIISQHDFDMVQKRLKTRPYSMERRGSSHPLSGYVYCADCGSRMTFMRVQTYSYFVCSDWRKKGKESSCSSHLVREDHVTEQLIHYLFPDNHDEREKVTSKALLAELNKRIDSVYVGQDKNLKIVEL